MVRAYSRLRRVLDEREMTVPELHRRIARDGLRVNLQSLYRLSRENHPVERLDLRVAGMICQVCHVPLSDLITFETTEARLRHFDASKQSRALMTRTTTVASNAGGAGRTLEVVREAGRTRVEQYRRMLAEQNGKPTSR